ncbi:MAG: threonine/serine dehydratase [Rhodospirillaceae bacterium]|nr:threonine/serine dehydratase [Rhodospirillaceae bacterium]
MPDGAASPTPPNFDDVLDAARRLAGRAVVTPLLNAPLLDAELGGRLFVKAEPLQRTGSFKFRGAYNRISRLTAAEREAGVIAYSSGNHAQGVAAAAREVGCDAVVVMPKDAPALKIARTKAFGAEVVLYDRHGESREKIAEELQRARRRVLVKPFDDRYVIAGQGTVGNEIADQCAERGIAPDAVFVPVGGGGLVAGSALALHRKLPKAEIYGCEPEHYDDTARSLLAGERVAVETKAATICDALMSPMPGEITFDLNRRLLAGAFAVTDAEVRRAMAAAFVHFKLVVEPGGAVGLAALLAGRYSLRGKTAVVVCSGGNADPALFADIVAAG